MTIEFLLVALPAFCAMFIPLAILSAWTLHAYQGKHREISRLRKMATDASGQKDRPYTQPDASWSLLPKLGAFVSNNDQYRVENLRTKMRYAGYFDVTAPLYFVAVQVLLVAVLSLACGLIPWALNWMPLQKIYFGLATGAGVGYLAPGFWLGAQIRKRQRLLRNGFPDALDIMVLCVEGGLSLNAAMQWVTDELHSVHAELGSELGVVYREMQMGLPAGEAMRNFANRCGLADVRDLAAVLVQSDKFGSGIAKTLRCYADSSRQDRQNKAEEAAQKTAVKILFPTILCIFPAIFMVLMGPAALQLTKLFNR